MIGRHHLDTNHHVNNSQYVEIAKDAIPVGLKIREIRADYKKAARLGDTVIPRITPAGQGQWTVALVMKRESFMQRYGLEDRSSRDSKRGADI